MKKKNNKKLYYLVSIAVLVVIPLISIGYSALSTTLNIRGDLFSVYVNPRTKTFPDEIEYLMDNEECMAKYSGQVTDEVGQTVTAKNVYFDRCTDKRNVIFGGFCWQIIRTTETGGIKMIYNGEPVDGKCESTRSDHKGIVGANGTTQYLNASYLYGSSFTYDTTNNKFTLVDTTTATWSDSTYQNLLGMFTCKNTTGTCSTIYNVNGYNSAINAYTSSYTIADTNYAQIGSGVFNANYKSPAMAGYMFNKVYNLKSIIPGTNTYKYGNSFTYSNGTYTLSGTTQDLTTLSGANINNTHYTCWNDTGTCTTISYVYYINGSRGYYIEISNGKSITDIVNEMLYDNNVNTYNSSIKGIIDSWYAQNLADKTTMLEDTVYCNSRVVINQSTSGFNPEGGSTSTSMHFKNFDETFDLSCLNETDQFTTSNNQARLTYPVSLITNEEWENIGIDSLRKTNIYYWDLSPVYFDNNSIKVRTVGSSGDLLSSSSVNTYNGSRPAVSLKNGIEFEGGSGSEADPWIVPSPRTKTFPSEIEYLMDNESCMTRYNGSVTDSVGVTTPIATNVYFNKCADKRNIIFNNMCWQMIRTTETGGIKMIYNGEPDNNGQCGSSRGNHKGIVGANGSTLTLNASYLYGDSFTYDITNNTFTLTDTTTATWSDSTFENLLGKFTCKNTTGTCTTLYNVNGYSNSTTAYTSSYTIGDTNYSQIGKSSFNANRYSPAMVGYMFNKVYNYKSGAPTSESLMGNDVSYSNGTYTLLPANGESELGTTLDNHHHYTCNTTSSTCNKVRYYYYISGSNNYYIELDGGEKIEDAVNNMLYNNNVNRYNSSIKGIIDAWYAQNLLSKTNMLEDTVYCNARNMINQATNGWNKDGSLSTNMDFKNYNQTTDLACPNETDQFAASNNKAKLTYPVSLINNEELYNIGTSSLRKTSATYWGLSPGYFTNYAYVLLMGSDGFFGSSGVYVSFGSRPTISLKNGIDFDSGSGSEADPWIIANPKLNQTIMQLSATNNRITKYEGNVTDTVGSTTSATKVYFDKDPDKRNLIFGGYCWQVIRTTETGGTKVIYNGEVVDGKCESSRGTHKGIVGASVSTQTLNAEYLYGDSFTYDITNNTFTLVDTTTATWSDSTYQNLLGKFTCKNTTGTCTTLYNVNGYRDSTRAYTSSYTIGDTNYAQIGTSPFNANYYSPAMVGYMFNKVYNWTDSAPTSGSLMGNDVSYSNGTYTLLPANGESTLGTTKDATHHYTCNNTTGTCSKVRYYYYSIDSLNFYIELDGAENIQAAVNEMLYNNDVNRYNSSIKGIIDAWYKQNMISKTNMLEDTVYCNARNITYYGGWDPEGPTTTDYNMKFKNYTLNNDLSCTNTTDQFAVSNNKAKLTYPVALATHEELYILTNKNSSYYYGNLTNTGVNWWDLSPGAFTFSDADVRSVYSNGSVYSYNAVYDAFGLRFVVSLNSNVIITGGTGSETDPWIIN